MSAEEAQSEPTMEEILASIRRIISEDDEAAPASEAVSDEEPLELNETPDGDILESDMDLETTSGMLGDIEPQADPLMDLSFDEEEPAEPDDDLVTDDDWSLAMAETDAPEEDLALETTEVPPEAPEPEPEPQPEPAPVAAKAASAPAVEEGLVAAETASATAGALGKLMGSMMLSQGLTLEDLVREMLKPMLKEWLDDNLPTLVEQEVAKELQRISRMARK